jgi:hypothetical protein
MNHACNTEVIMRDAATAVNARDIDFNGQTNDFGEYLLPSYETKIVLES